MGNYQLVKEFIAATGLQLTPRDITMIKNIDTADVSESTKDGWITDIFLNNRQLGTLSEEAMGIILQMTGLKSFTIIRDTISTLPDNFGRLDVENIDLSNNSFEIFPNQVLSISNLKALELSNNMITEVPAEKRRDILNRS